MKVLAGCMPNECGQEGTLYSSTDFTQSLGIVLSSSFPIEIQYYKDLDPTSGLSAIPFIRFVWESENTSPYMEYMNCGNERCFFASCPPLSNQNTFQYDPEFPPQQADPGIGGADAPDGTLGNNPDDNVIVEDYATWIVQPTGLDKDLQKQPAVFIYPNPSRDILYLNISDMQSKQQPKVDIYDMTGKLITKDVKLMLQKDATYKLDINYLPKGQYLLDIQIGNTTMHKTFTRQ
jgi:hypothetical protein